jgi:nucleoside-diphosphate-sugar epimerase
MIDLAGKTALVTGASRGIGRATALGLSNAGAQVLVHYSSGKTEASAVVAQIRQAGGRAEAVAADLRSRYSIQQAGLRGGGALLVAQLHPAQRPYRAWARRSIQPHKGFSRVPLLRGVQEWFTHVR